MTNKIVELISDSTEPARKIEILKEYTEQRLCLLIHRDEVPKELAYIVDEVTLRRFNRLGNEGMSASTQEGLSMTFNDDDFREYRNELEEWKRANTKRKGGIFYNV